MSVTGHVLIKAPDGQIGVYTPLYLHVDGDWHETTVSAVNRVEGYIKSKADADSAIVKFLAEGGTEHASQCADEIAQSVIPGAPEGMRRELLNLRECLKEKNVAFLTDNMEPQEQAADKSLIDEVHELKTIATELLKTERDAEVIEKPEE